MSKNMINREGKDALFKLVFGDHPENALSLYNAINGTDYTNVGDLEITTLRDAVYIGIKNDVSFLFNHDMNLYEHQSSFCPNMPLRGLGYFADLYQIYLGGEEVTRARLYDRALVEIPAPKYYVFYNGTESREEREDLHLSSSYEGEGDIEITAHMINVNAGYNAALMESCKPLADYSEFVNRVRENSRSGLTKEDAVDRAIDSCIKDGILDGMLRKERAKVANALYTALTEEEIEELRRIQLERATKEGLEKGIAEGLEKGIAEGLEKGIAAGREEGKFEDVLKLISGGVLDEENACRVLEVNQEDYVSWKAKNDL